MFQVALRREASGGKVARVCWRNSEHLKWVLLFKKIVEIKKRNIVSKWLLFAKFCFFLQAPIKPQGILYLHSPLIPDGLPWPVIQWELIKNCLLEKKRRKMHPPMKVLNQQQSLSFSTISCDEWFNSDINATQIKIMISSLKESNMNSTDTVIMQYRWYHD